MPRLSPITVALAVLMLGILGAAVFLVVGAHHARERSVDPGETAAAPSPAEAPPHAREITVAPPAPPPPPPWQPPVLAQPAPVATETNPDTQAPGADAQLAAAPPNRRALLLVNHNRRRQEADETVFAGLGLPEETRAAIRQINEEYRRQTEPPPGSDRTEGAPLGVGEASAALKAREDAITRLLGADGAKEFGSQERNAVLKLRGKYRFEWGRQLRE